MYKISNKGAEFFHMSSKSGPKYDTDDAQAL